LAKLLKTGGSSWKITAQCAKSFQSGFHLNLRAESLMNLSDFVALKLSFYKSFIAEKAPLNEPADAGGII
jgi:hypothetical protein